MRAITVRVPAKVNLQLAVGPLREDGYHDLVNVFHAVSLFDEVTAAEPGDLGDPGRPIKVTVRGESAAEVPADDGNLAVRAAQALARSAGRSYRADLVIDKAIPVAGGMAGGSADAAAALVACNELWGLGLPVEDLMEIAADIGSDVPFALLGGTAVGTGRGERLTPLETAGVFHWVFALADGGLSTPRVYGECDRLREARGIGAPQPTVSESLLAALREGDAKELGRALCNDLQPAALSLRPSLARTLEVGLELGALGAIVSGSGPTCAFLAESQAHAADLAAALANDPACSALSREAGLSRSVVTAFGPVPGAVSG
ncbi:4-(cytidine 5'-diphospho)-2-C-methyl-D-erythritol kinase [Sphaerimonospora thailandensis]|uniref:4-diphosphocytidyl-2-C-methyl-D-erythritol kinase n=1 Tax=Sphaerimonospora thailandensis TaxID=795644 RepID=A0A8J3RCX4_9ACTN|nr:4-(cytidine 5'-diphospho)-2-C-methyl-D-erythritol kinase [Sphaerimonospora thailandensis]GIH72300.1 4-diphosphocytidyl-2-C-methyl-D-erythritol kinase [Sphaerimonospora thailandensis]